MTLQLTGKEEPKGLYQEFYGNPLQQMPLLIEWGYKPISVAGTIDRRESAPADVVDRWRHNYIFTGDGAAYDGRRNAKLVLDAALLREISSDTKLDHYAMVLSDDQWEEMRGEDVLYLSAGKVAQAHEKGFVKRNGVWRPENTIVGDVWEHLSRGKDLKEYAEMVSEASNSKKIMRLWFDKNNYDSPVMRSLVLDRIGGSSIADGYYDLGDYGGLGRLVGVAQEMRKLPHFCAEKKSDVSFLAPEAHVAREKGGPYRNAGRFSEEVLEEILAKVLSPFDEFVGTVNKSQYESLKQQALRELKGLLKGK